MPVVHAVVGDTPIPVCERVQLLIPGLGAGPEAVEEDDGLTLAPLDVVDIDAVELDETHRCLPNACVAEDFSTWHPRAAPSEGNMGHRWPPLPYEEWSDTCDTIHAHTQVLGKLAVSLAPPEPQLQHAALRLTARGWETLPLPAPDGSGALGAGLDLHSHEAFVEHSNGRTERVALTPNRAVGEVTRELLAAARSLAG